MPDTVPVVRILELSLAGLRSYRRRMTLDLSDASVAAVTGRNGAGKSTLFDAVLFGLYGTIPGQAQSEIINEDCDKAEVELVIEVDGQTHTFHRVRTKSKSAAEYTSPDGSKLEAVRPVTQAAEGLLHAGYDLLSLTAFSRQGESGRFGSLDAAQRRKMLSDVMLGDMFVEAADLAADRKSVV